jgi:hypothetical protein
MQCEKCQGNMLPTKVFRLSGCLVALGFTILIPCFLLLCFAIVVGAIGTAATGGASVKVTERAKQEALGKLQAIEGLSPVVVAEFGSNTRLSEVTIDSLTSEQSNQVYRIQSHYNTQVSGAAVGTGLFALVGGGFVIAMLAICIPGLIVGFLLILRKKVWRCQQCGFIFDRA